MRYLFPLLLLLSCCLTLLPGCEPREDLVQTTGALEFDRDTVKFDTVFTTIRTVTKRLWVYNRNSGAVKTDVSLAGRQGTTFSLIINGDAGNSLSGVTIRGKDSVLVLVRAVLGDNSINKPFLLEDQINFRTNGNEQNVKLVAYGQNAYFHRADVISGNRTEIWRSDKPHVIINALYPQTPNPPVSIGVYVAAGSTLQIEPGTKIYCHAGATIQVDGTLKINDAPPTIGDTTAAKRAMVLFRGDRLESFYNEIPGQWGGIFFTSTSRRNVIRYTEIKNANFGVSLLNTDATNITPPDLRLENVVIRNISGSNPSYVGTGLPPGGIVGVRSNISAQNCLLTNCGEYAVRGYGGRFTLNFCTIANYTPAFQRQTSSVSFSNELRDADNKPIKFPLAIKLTNSIVWGNYEDELELVNNADYLDSLNIRNTLLRTKDFQATTNTPNKPGLGAPSLVNLVTETDPLFIRTSLISSRPDYRLQPTSPARARAAAGTVPANDLPNRFRPASPQQNLGAYAFDK